MLRQLIAAAVIASAVAPSAFAEPAAPRAALDENALRYYASLGQRDRVAAEAMRLSRLDPEWHMPDDLYSARPGRLDEAPLWNLFGEGRIDDVEKAIAMRQAVEPGWKPSEDLSAKIKTKLLRVHVMALAKAQDWHAIVESFKSGGIAWAKDDAEALWIAAEAYARENDCGEAYVIYHAILADYAAPDERRATIEHAIALIPMAYAEKLIAMAHLDGKGESEFAPIATDITRARISAYLHDEPANEVGDAELKSFEDAVRDAVDPNEPGLVAWYGFKRHDYPLALEWFKLAIGRGGDAMIAHGLAHTLRAMGETRAAEEVAYAWRGPLVNNSILFTDLLETDFTKEQPPFIEPARVARYAQVTMATESGEGAQALGWYAYNTCQYPLALQWFQRAVAWLPKEATVYGYALSLQRMRRANEFREIVNRYDGLFPKVVALAFDDGIRKPPPPCEANPRTPTAPPRAQTVQEGQDWTGRTMADTLKPRAVALPGRDAQDAAPSARARVPSPDMAAGGDAALPPLTKKTDFPVAVVPENPLRFSFSRTVASEDQRAHARDIAWPLVARRVPGVGAMPYERYGFTLPPGWDGTTDPSSPTSAERSPPQGTLWALEQSLRAGAKDSFRSSDPLSRQPTVRTTAALRSDRRL